MRSAATSRVGVAPEKPALPYTRARRVTSAPMARHDGTGAEALRQPARRGMLGRAPGAGARRKSGEGGAEPAYTRETTDGQISCSARGTDEGAGAGA